jgi:methionyl-tRNA formyltransferase
MAMNTRSPSEDSPQTGKLRIVFFGTERWAVPLFEALVAAGHEITAAVREGRSDEGGPDSVAAAWRIPVLDLQATDMRELDKTLRRFAPQVQVVAGWHSTLPKAVLGLAPLGTVKVHLSVLPRYRGASPIEWAILNGDKETGVTAFLMDETQDAGPVLVARTTAIACGETGGELRQRLAGMAAEVLIETLSLLSKGALTPRPQTEAQASQAPAIAADAGRIDWSTRADVLARRIRAFHPWPGSTTELMAQQLIIDRAHAEQAGAGAPGTVLEAGVAGILVACGEGTGLRVTQLHLEGQRPMSPAGFVTRSRLSVGTRLG